MVAVNRLLGHTIGAMPYGQKSVEGRNVEYPEGIITENDTNLLCLIEYKGLRIKI